MNDRNSPMHNKTKQLLAWILSLQFAGLMNVIPAITLISSFTFVSQVYADKTVVPTEPPPPPKGEGEKLKGEGEKLPGNGAYMEGGHGGGQVVEAQPQKKRFCRDESGKWKVGCTVAFVLLGIAAIIGIVALTKRKKSCQSCVGSYPRPGRPSRPNRPDRPDRPDERPPVVECCKNPSPAPGPGTPTSTSNVTTGNSAVPGVEPIVVNP
jgi:hypothetical protein